MRGNDVSMEEPIQLKSVGFSVSPWVSKRGVQRILDEMRKDTTVEISNLRRAV